MSLVYKMFEFEKCTFDELQIINKREKLSLIGWKMLQREYIDETMKIYNLDGGREESEQVYLGKTVEMFLWKLVSQRQMA